MPHFVEYPCPNCNSELNFDSESQNLKCQNCNTLIPITKSNEIIEEQRISEFFNTASLPPGEIGQISYTCSKCGKENINTQDVAFFECKHCKNNIINTEAYQTKKISPGSLVPFEISKEEALGIFQNWIGKGFWNDSDLKKLALNDHMQGYYIPFWTFDSLTESEWSGESGRYYYVNESYTDSDGKRQTRQVQKTSWSYRSGTYNHQFDDVLISGTQEISQNLIKEIYPYDLTDLKPFDFQYLLGWSAKAFDGNMTESYNLFHEYIDAEIYNQCANRLKDDTYRNLEVQTKYFNETFKHIVLPLWYCQYIFKGKTYYYIINGQTGKISGKKPLSTTKIAAAVIIGILILVLLFILAGS